MVVALESKSRTRVGLRHRRSLATRREFSNFVVVTITVCGSTDHALHAVGAALLRGYHAHGDRRRMHENR